MWSGVIDLEYWKDYCQLIFGEIKLNVEATNTEFGSVTLRGSNILFTNGIEDQWQWCGVKESIDQM